MVGRRSLRELSFKAGDVNINTSESVRYLGLAVNRNMTMTRHVVLLREKALTDVKQLNSLMPNMAGPSSGKRRLLAAVVHSIVLYAAPLWADVLKYTKYRGILQQIQTRPNSGVQSVPYGI